ncbi:hypothetical protein [Helicobacter cinaedi]|uniref:hypothetical protein n=2 Tax=Helicobacter cinaedi TaxID=213 RepID=UPI001E4A4988|nr:hypothetical protein [Helicobacter cinaedi]
MSKIEIFSMKSARMGKQKLESSPKTSLDSTLPTDKRDKNTQPIDTQSLDFDFSLLQKLFPQCAKGLDSKIVGTLLASTHIVGMKTPGLHSIYSSLEFDFSKGHSACGLRHSVLSDKSGSASPCSLRRTISVHHSQDLHNPDFSSQSLECQESKILESQADSTNPHGWGVGFRAQKDSKTQVESSLESNTTAEVSLRDFGESANLDFSNSKIFDEKCGLQGKSQGGYLKGNDRRDFSQLPHLSQKAELPKETTQSKLVFLYYTHTTHPRLNITTIRTIAPFSGTIKAFIRPIPLKNESFESISQSHPTLTKNKPFATQKALVIGAGSGFGNVCVKMLLLGGAEVLATTHSKDFDEPHKHLQTLCYDTTAANKKTLEQFRIFNPTHIYYFATPKIRSTHTLDKKLLNEFLSFYIFGLHNILESLETSTLRGIFQPSTCFVDELPLDMQNYTIAKSALETYALFLAKQYHCKIATPRMQKSATNQTLSLIPQNLQKPSSVLLDEILEFSKGM